MRILVTGGAGFIGSNLIRHILSATEHEVINVDKLTYAGLKKSLADVESNPRYEFDQPDVSDAEATGKLFQRYRPQGVIHLAAESHVDRSIAGPDPFIRTNVIGTFNLLKSTREYLASLSAVEASEFRFQHVSTDEVYGALREDELAFTELSRYDPHSPYSASKAASDHLVRAWKHTYRLPILIAICSNVFGPYQYPEKLIPVVILNAINGRSIPVYGTGKNIRDWLHVEDAVGGLLKVFIQGQLGETYNIGGNNELRNIDLVRMLCKILDELQPLNENKNISESLRTKLSGYADLIEFVEDRPGHDVRYAICSATIERELGWRPQVVLDEGMRNTVQWYLNNVQWWSELISGGSEWAAKRDSVVR